MTSTAVDETSSHAKCDKLLASALKDNKTIHHLIDSIETLGCAIPKEFFVCRTCDTNITGGFAVNTNTTKEHIPKIIACENHLQDKGTFESTLVHELIHAYDVCRSKIDFKNCLQHACTEIRASSLSGECSLRNEIYRGNVQMSLGHQECVKRRATLSLKMNPNCANIAAEAVAAGFLKCYKDSSPFDPDTR